MAKKNKQEPIKLGLHFVQRWRERVGGPAPTRDGVQMLIDQSVMIQRGRRYFSGQGRPVDVLALYWHPDQKIVIKVDSVKKMAVTVLTDHVLRDAG